MLDHRPMNENEHFINTTTHIQGKNGLSYLWPKWTQDFRKNDWSLFNSFGFTQSKFSFDTNKAHLWIYFYFVFVIYFAWSALLIMHFIPPIYIIPVWHTMRNSKYTKEHSLINIHMCLNISNISFWYQISGLTTSTSKNHLKLQFQSRASMCVSV